MEPLADIRVRTRDDCAALPTSVADDEEFEWALATASASGISMRRVSGSSQKGTRGSTCSKRAGAAATAFPAKPVGFFSMVAPDRLADAFLELSAVLTGRSSCGRGCGDPATGDRQNGGDPINIAGWSHTSVIFVTAMNIPGPAHQCDSGVGSSE